MQPAALRSAAVDQSFQQNKQGAGKGRSPCRRRSRGFRAKRGSSFLGGGAGGGNAPAPALFSGLRGRGDAATLLKLRASSFWQGGVAALRRKKKTLTGWLSLPSPVRLRSTTCGFAAARGFAAASAASSGMPARGPFFLRPGYEQREYERGPHVRGAREQVGLGVLRPAVQREWLSASQVLCGHLKKARVYYSCILRV